MARIIDADQMESDELRTFLKESRAEAAAAPAPAPAPATTPAAPAPAAPQPTKAMLEGKEYSQTQFKGMEPIYEGGGTSPRGGGEFLGYGFKYSQLPGYGMVPVYAEQIRGEERGPMLGYEFNPIAAGLKPEDVPKPANVLAREQQLGTTMEPIYASWQQTGRGGSAASDPIYYGPPIGYRYDNGKSQYVNFDANGTYQNTYNRTSAGDAFGGIALSFLSLIYPPIAPFIQAYNAVKAIDSGDTLGFILNAAGASAKIPGLDSNTSKLLTNVSTGAKIVQAVESKDPLKILSATANIPNVDPSLKDLGIVLNTVKAVNDGNITGAFNGILKISDRNSVGRLTEKFDDIVNGQDVAALNPPPDEKAAQEQADREQAAREAVRASEKTIEDTLTKSGLVSTDNRADTFAQEQADREQAAREATRASEKTIEDTLTNAGLVTDTKKLDEVTVTGKAPTEIEELTPIVKQEEVAPVVKEEPTPNGGALKPVTIATKKPTEIEELTPTVKQEEPTPVVKEEPTPDGGALKPVTITGKRDDLIPLEQMPPLPDNTVKEVIAGTPQEPKPTIPTIPKLPTIPTQPATPTTPARQPTPSQAQRLADAFAVPTLANTFYGNADFSTKKVEVDDEGNIIEVPYEPIDVSKPASKSLLANGGQITDNSTNHLVALLNHIMGSQDRNQLTEDDLLNIVRKGI